ncbi:MAG: hypothetical protein LBN27_11240 [Prevotellaceae bacterium]|jgi:hypothetical protein|nr:hypothetical protein [Prevotellaceae bacterium]
MKKINFVLFLLVCVFSTNATIYRGTLEVSPSEIFSGTGFETYIAVIDNEENYSIFFDESTKIDEIIVGEEQSDGSRLLSKETVTEVTSDGISTYYFLISGYIKDDSLVFVFGFSGTADREQIRFYVEGKLKKKPENLNSYKGTIRQSVNGIFNGNGNGIAPLDVIDDVSDYIIFLDEDLMIDEIVVGAEQPDDSRLLSKETAIELSSTSYLYLVSGYIKEDSLIFVLGLSPDIPDNIRIYMEYRLKKETYFDIPNVSTDIVYPLSFSAEKAILKEEYFGIDGKPLRAKDISPLHIKRTVYTDGTVKVEKVLR